MTRQNRLIVMLVVIGLAGTAALALLAQQLRSRTEVKSIRDLPAAADGAPAAQPSADPAPGADAGRAVRLVDGFLAVRKAESEVLARHPVKAKQIEAALTGNYDLVKGQRMGLDLDFLQEFRLARVDTLEKTKVSAAEYAEARKAYRAWSSGGSVAQELAPALEARRADLEKAGLGGLEVLDDQVK